MCWWESADIPSPGPDKSCPFPHTLLATLCQYIKDNSFILTHSWLHCVHISETTVLSSHAVGHTVYIYHRQKLYLITLLATLCTYTRDKSFIDIYVFLYRELWYNYVMLATLSSHAIGYTVYVYQRRQFYPHTLLATLFTYIRGNSSENGVSALANFNHLKPTGYVMHHQQFNIQQLYALPTLYLWVLYLSENKQRLVPLTA